jgi:hypothetical protein
LNHHLNHRGTGTAAEKIASTDDRLALALRTLNAFLISEDDAVDATEHVPPKREWVATTTTSANTHAARREVKTSSEELASFATALWDAMKDKGNATMPMTDAGYLKLYQVRSFKRFSPTVRFQHLIASPIN